MMDAQQDAEIHKAPSATKPIAQVLPEEGRRGWLCVLGGFLMLFSSFGFLNAVGVFQSYYQANSLSQYTPSQISLIFAFQLMCMWIAGPLFGRIVDAQGPLVITVPCSILAVFSLGMTSLATEYYQIFLAQGVGFGIGAGGIFAAAFICVGQWFVKRRGLATGLASVGSSLGGVIFPLFFEAVIPTIGFAGAMRYATLLVGLPLLVGIPLVQSRLPKKQWDRSARWIEPKLFTQPEFALYTVGSFLVMWAVWVPFDFISSFSIAQNNSDELSLAMISIINAASIPGRIIPPYLSDRFGHFETITAADWTICLSILCLWLPFSFYPSLAGTIVFALVYGFVSGSFVSLLMPCVAKLGPIDTIGVRFGTLQVVLGIANLTGLPIAGSLLARQGDTVFWGLQTFAIVAAFSGAMMSTYATVIIRRTSNVSKK